LENGNPTGWKPFIYTSALSESHSPAHLITYACPALQLRTPMSILKPQALPSASHGASSLNCLTRIHSQPLSTHTLCSRESRVAAQANPEVRNVNNNKHQQKFQNVFPTGDSGTKPSMKLFLVFLLQYFGVSEAGESRCGVMAPCLTLVIA